MKIMHTSDLHLGKVLNGYSLIDDQKDILERLLESAKEKDVDVIMISGDIYDKSVPSEETVTLFDDFLYKASNSGIRIVAISGNHDSAERLNYASRLMESKGIYIAGVYDGHVKKVTVTDRNNVKVNFYLLPFVRASQVAACHRDKVMEGKSISYEEAVSLALSDVKPDAGEWNILLCHQFVAADDKEPEMAGSEMMVINSVGTLEKVSYRVFDGFDYAALGHIHRSQKVGRENVRYSGSLLKYSLSEANDEKSIPLITIDNNTKTDGIKIDYMKLKPKRDIIHLRGRLEDVINTDTATESGCFVYVTLTDEEIPIEAAERLKMKFPSLLSIDYDNRHFRDIKKADITDDFDKISFKDLVGKFYMQITGNEITDEEMQIISEAAREAEIQ
jgi:DNA repair protein SbcD/Mre11